MTPEIQSNTAVAIPLGIDGHRFAAARTSPAAEALVAESTPAPAPAPEMQQAPAPEMQQAIEQIERYLERHRSDLQFRVDRDSGRVIMSIVDRRDGTVLRQIPNDDVLRIARLLAQEGQGLVDAFA